MHAASSFTTELTLVLTCQLFIASGRDEVNEIFALGWYGSLVV